jgi:hypothetical protein
VNQPVVDDASNVVCSGGTCGISQCCKPEVTCDSYATCPGGNRPLKANAANIVCTKGVCGTPQCCKDIRCNTFRGCKPVYQLLMGNAGSIVCRNGICNNAQCCRKHPNCPRNRDRFQKCERDCQCLPRWKCLYLDRGGQKSHVCHC